MSESIKIAHISDLHIGEAARFSDFNPASVGGAGEEIFFDSFKRFVIEKNIKADFLFVTGDITNRGNFPEFKRSWDVILEIARLLGVREEKIAFAPGNHDKNWSVSKAAEGAPTSDRHRMQYMSMMQSESKNILRKITESGDGSYDADPYFISWNFDDIFVIGYNSAIFDEPEISPHNGKIEIESIAALERKIKEFGEKIKHKTKVFLVHHHAIQYTDPFSRALADYSIMENGHELIKMLHENDFDLMLHGHKHFPQFSIHSDESMNPLVVIGAGSLSAKIEGKYNGDLGNLFHLVEVQRNSHNGFRVQGGLRSWKYRTLHGWDESDTSFGIDHYMPFGRFSSDEQVRQIIEEPLKNGVSASGWVSLKAITDADPDLQYVTKGQITRVVRLCADSAGFKIVEKSGDVIVLGEKCL